MSVTVKELGAKFGNVRFEHVQQRFHDLLDHTDFSLLKKDKSFFFSGEIYGEQLRDNDFTKSIASADKKTTASQASPNKGITVRITVTVY